MALKLNLEYSDVGVGITDAYARITNWSGNKDQTQFTVEFYFNQAARETGARSVRTEAYHVATADAPDISGMYNWLKTQPGYESAEDV